MHLRTAEGVPVKEINQVVVYSGPHRLHEVCRQRVSVPLICVQESEHRVEPNR
jgi:hypothetical protein